MTTREARGLAAVDSEEESIAGYLQRNPEFFERHQAVLARLRLPHARGGSTISLVERQIEVLREKQAALERKLAELVRVARANDALAERLHRFTRRLLRAAPRAAAIAHIEAGLREDFDAFHAVLVLIGEPPDPSLPAFVRTVAADDAGAEVLRVPVRQRQAALRPGARLAARVPVRPGRPGDGLGGAGAARREGLDRPAGPGQRATATASIPA